jgi:hypothetical protein
MLVDGKMAGFQLLQIGCLSCYSVDREQALRATRLGVVSTSCKILISFKGLVHSHLPVLDTYLAFVCIRHTFFVT